VLNWVLIFGHLGAPVLGVAGSGYASAINQWLMLAGLALCTRIMPGLAGFRGAFAASRFEMANILRLGLPIGGLRGTGVGLIFAPGILMGLLGAAALGAHQLVLNCAGMTFMVPLGLGQGRHGAGAPCDVEIVPNCNHSYVGREAAICKLVRVGSPHAECQRRAVTLIANYPNCAELIVIFCDLRGFTRFSGAIEAEKLMGHPGALVEARLDPGIDRHGVSGSVQLLRSAARKKTIEDLPPAPSLRHDQWEGVLPKAARAPVNERGSGGAPAPRRPTN